MNLNSTNPIYYIYRHIRADKDEVFYVGVGKLNQKGRYFRTKYKRAFCKKSGGRNRYWSHIIGVTDYSVEILFHTENFKEALKKEIEFIKLYGRKDLNEGTLANLTDGADCPHNVIVSEAVRLKMSQNSGIKGKFGDDHHRSQPVFAYKSSGEFIKRFGSKSSAAKFFKIHHKSIFLVLNGECRHASGLLFFNEYRGESVDAVDIESVHRKPINCYDSNKNFIKTFDSVTIAAHFVGSSTTHISRSAKNPFVFSCKKHYFTYSSSE